MDENYIESLAGSPHVDEGLWNQMKAKAAGVSRGIKNIAGRPAGETEGAKLNSLWKGFTKSLTKITTDFLSVIKQQDATKLTEANWAEINKFWKLLNSLKKLEKISIAEANAFTRPFSLLGSQWGGNPDQIVQAYKTYIGKLYDKFVADAKALNIVPDQYLGRKIGSLSPEVPKFIRELETLTGKNHFSSAITPPETSATPAPTSPTSPAPVSSPSPSTPTPTAPVPTPSPTPSPSAPVAPSSPTPTPMSPSVASSTTTPSAGSSTSMSTEDANVINSLVQKSLVQIVKESSFQGKDPERDSGLGVQIDPEKRGELKKQGKIASTTFDAQHKARVVVPASSTSPNKEIVWHLRFFDHRNKHGFQYLEDVHTQTPEGKFEKTPAKQWQILMEYQPKELFEPGLKETFDPYKIIARSNPKIREAFIVLRNSGVKVEDEKIREASKQAIGKFSILNAADPETREKSDTEDPMGIGTGGKLDKTQQPGTIPPDQQGRTSPMASPGNSAVVQPTGNTADSTPPKPSATKTVGSGKKGETDTQPQVEVDQAGNIVTQGVGGKKDVQSPIEALTGYWKSTTGNVPPKWTRKHVSELVDFLKTLNVKTDQLERFLKALEPQLKQTGAKVKSKPAPVKPTLASTPKATKPTSKPVPATPAKAASPAPTSNAPVAPVKKKPEAQKPAPVTPTATTPVEKKPEAPKGSIFGSDAERLKRANDTFIVPNNLAPLTSTDQLKSFYSALGSQEEPSPTRIKAAYQQAMGNKTLPPATGATPVKEEFVAPRSLKEWHSF